MEREEREGDNDSFRHSFCFFLVLFSDASSLFPWVESLSTTFLDYPFLVFSGRYFFSIHFPHSWFPLVLLCFHHLAESFFLRSAVVFLVDTFFHFPVVFRWSLFLIFGPLETRFAQRCKWGYVLKTSFFYSSSLWNTSFFDSSSLWSTSLCTPLFSSLVA